MKPTTALLTAASIFFSIVSSAYADDNEFSPALIKLAIGKIYKIAQNEILIKAIAEHKKISVSYDQDWIDAKDRQWRLEIATREQPLIESLLSTSASKFLKKTQRESDGLFTEISIMDQKGINVGQSPITPDYWQGDEAHWKGSHQAGASSVFIGSIGVDEASQILPGRISVPIVSNRGKLIGAITFGVDVKML